MAYTVKTGRLDWDAATQHYYQTGVSHGVLYPAKTTADTTNNTYASYSSGTITPSIAGTHGVFYEAGVVWNGLTNVTESPEGAEANDLWADNIKYGSLRSAETLSGSIEAYTFPPEFNQCNGFGSVSGLAGLRVGQQTRKAFGFVCENVIGSDSGTEVGKQYNIYYNCTASPSEEAHETINDSPDAATFSWDFDTTPFGEFTIDNVPYKPTASLKFTYLTGGVSTATMESLTTNQMKALENILYGEKGKSDACLPSPAEIIAILKAVPTT